MKLGRTDKQDTPLIPVTLRGRAVVWRSLADPIWASGHVAALTGRTHGRFRPAANLLAKPLNPRGRPHMVLLAFELFVIVVAVDARWVEESLKKNYQWLADAEGVPPTRRATQMPSTMTTAVR